MQRTLPERPMLAAARLLLAAALALPLLPAARAQEPAEGAAGAELDLSRVPLEHFSAIVERPLFSPTRKPPPGSAGGPNDGASAAIKQFQLKGVVVSEREQLALIVSQSTGKTYQVRTGDVIEGWRVERITDQSAAFVKDGVRELVPLVPRRNLP